MAPGIVACDPLESPAGWSNPYFAGPARSVQSAEHALARSAKL